METAQASVVNFSYHNCSGNQQLLYEKAPTLSLSQYLIESVNYLIPICLDHFSFNRDELMLGQTHVRKTQEAFAALHLM